MFAECNELINLDLSNFNTSKVTDMYYMFYKCYKLKEIKGIYNFRITDMTDLTEMFDECYKKNFYLFLKLKINVNY